MLEAVLSTGPTFQRILGDVEQVRFGQGSSLSPASREIEGGREQSYGNIQYLKLYNHNTPFEEEKWALAGIVEKNVLFSFSGSVMLSVFIAMLISLVIGLMTVILVGLVLTRPVQRDGVRRTAKRSEAEPDRELVAAGLSMRCDRADLRGREARARTWRKTRPSCRGYSENGGGAPGRI